MHDESSVYTAIILLYIHILGKMCNYISPQCVFKNWWWTWGWSSL